MRYTAFDVETPNQKNDRMSAIGVALIEDGMIVQEYDTIVDPMTFFEPFHIELTGITPEMAKKSPTFPEVWNEIAPLFEDSVLVAHNAPFDLGVLCKCLHAYGIQWKTTVKYVCTVRLGRVCYPGLNDHRLDTLCDRVGIELDHHRAGSDTHACAELLLDYISHDIDPERYFAEFDFLCGRTVDRWKRR